jgi:hypothetical protein
LNTLARKFTVKVTKPDTAAFKRVVVTIPALNQTILDEPLGDNVVKIDEATLKVRVTFHSASSPVQNPPPPFHTYVYAVKVVVEENAVEDMDQKDSATRHALWQMPDGFQRYGMRDTGGDDWCSHGTYAWMAASTTSLANMAEISAMPPMPAALTLTCFTSTPFPALSVAAITTAS